MQPSLMRRRMWRYVLPVLIFSLLLNITKFFEAYVIRAEDGKFSLRISDMRKNSLYSAITKWTRLLVLGLIPFAIIIYFNIRVYSKLRQRMEERNHRLRSVKARPAKCMNGQDVEVSATKWMLILGLLELS